MPQPYLAHAPYRRLIQQLEQAQLKLDEADELLAQLLAKFNVAESRLVRIGIERWRIETELSHLMILKSLTTYLLALNNTALKTSYHYGVC